MRGAIGCSPSSTPNDRTTLEDKPGQVAYMYEYEPNLPTLSTKTNLASSSGTGVKYIYWTVRLDRCATGFRVRIWDFLRFGYSYLCNFLLGMFQLSFGGMESLRHGLYFRSQIVLLLDELPSMCASHHMGGSNTKVESIIIATQTHPRPTPAAFRLQEVLKRP